MSSIDNELRQSLYNAVHEEFVGPVDPLSIETISLSPKIKYSAGILYPVGSEYEEYQDGEISHGGMGEDAGRLDAPEVLRTSKQAPVATDEEEPVALSNADYQAAMSVTLAVPKGAAFEVEVRAATYDEVSSQEGKGTDYIRRPLFWRSGPLAPPSATLKKSNIPIPGSELALLVVYRRSSNDSDILTIALRNTKHSDSPRGCTHKSCYFQSGFTVHMCGGRTFAPIPKWTSGSSDLSDEEQAKRLIYRKICNYAIGHGCAADWDETGPSPSWISTKTIPMEEVKPTSHRRMDGLEFDLYSFSQADAWSGTKITLQGLCDCYLEWIDSIETGAAALPVEYSHAAKSNISECRLVHKRMLKGLELLDKDGDARLAFLLANRAMLDQYLHYSVVSNEKSEVLEPARGLRSWRPFQIAFILMNIESMVDRDSESHGLLDLIWFPTGGGKTEAYLGLSAFTLLLERIRKEAKYGTSVIMRYTLRLLSAQQFDRASSLICALEMMRLSNQDLLGTRRFSIGLWAGKDASPNTWDEATNACENLRSGRISSDDNPIPVSCCPWCGTTMGEQGLGYKKKRVNGVQVISFVCPNSDCEFGTSLNSLPLKVVDEDIYGEPPSLLLGTVDKFAMIPYRPESYSIFGIEKDGSHASSPSLIIQDELHLISGPLGSMTAHYETLINDLASYESERRIISPKVIASTATISRAKEQCHELYACGRNKIVQFPPSGLNYDDSFFSHEDEEADGRCYVGLYVPNLSYATASIRLYANLLWTPTTWELDSDEDRDPYWTVVGYYGTTRELGQAATWANSDICERLYEKKRMSKGPASRFINRFIELTGRIDAPEVKRGLKSLEERYPSKKVIDLCLATNMISVGLDIKRLGVMVMAGQPKETAEYIQASSRVGRGDQAKGIVFVLYGTQRPRDRSHYENFKIYHKSFYQNVEPSSVTAFCPQVRERAMAGTLIGMYRACVQQNEKAYNDPDEDILQRQCAAILERVRSVDPTEVEGTIRHLEEIVKHWREYDHQRWQELNSAKERMGEDIPLIYPRGVEPLQCWGDAGFAVPTSMRSVETECRISVIGRYPQGECGDEE